MAVLLYRNSWVAKGVQCVVQGDFSSIYLCYV
jgi:hypothetical protein